MYSQNTNNAKRLRCLKHLKGGSFDLLDLKVLSKLKSKLMSGKTFFVIEFSCAPFQKGLDTEGKVYYLCLSFCKSKVGWVLMPTPFSLCDCLVRVLNNCAHCKGALLLVWSIQNYFGGKDFEGLHVHKYASKYS